MFVHSVNMNLTDLYSSLLSAGFHRTNNSTLIPIVIHGVPGCGKSTLIKQIVEKGDVEAYTLGAAYGDTLTHAGVRHLTDKPAASTARLRILDEYQLGPPGKLLGFNVLFGDPYQGPLRLPAHFVKRESHRVPRVIADHLRNALNFELTGRTEGVLVTRGTSIDSPIEGVIFHLGKVSKQLTHSHGLCSLHPTEASGLEFPEVTLVYHSSELKERDFFYIAATRAKNKLTLISDTFHELQTST